MSEQELKLPCIGGCGADIIPAERVAQGYLCPKCFELHEEQCRKYGGANYWIYLLTRSILKVPRSDGWTQSDVYRGDLVEFIKKQATSIDRLNAAFNAERDANIELRAEIRKRDEILRHYGVTEVL